VQARFESLIDLVDLLLIAADTNFNPDRKGVLNCFFFGGNCELSNGGTDD
jgi:hypothetical protein